MTINIQTLDWGSESTFWIGILYCLLTSFILRKSVFTLPLLITMGYLLAFFTALNEKDVEKSKNFQDLVKIIIFLFPICIMNNAMSVKRYIFRRSILPSLLLASLSYFLSISILTLLLKFFQDQNFEVLNYACIASVVLVTDSFALNNIIHRLPENVIFQNVIEGEAILKVCFGLSFFRLFFRLKTSTDFHSTLFLLNFIFEFLGGLGIAILIFYLFNKLKVWLIESQIVFEMCLMLICFFVCEIHLNLNGMVSIVVFSILMRFQYKSGDIEIDRVRYINLFSECIIAVLCIISGYLFYFENGLSWNTLFELFLMYILQTIVRAISVLLTIFLFRNTRFAVNKSQILVSVFGSMKGVNNLLLMFMVLAEVTDLAFAGSLIIKVVYLILINNLTSSFILWRFEKMKPDKGSIILVNKISLMKIINSINGEILNKQGHRVRLEKLTGYNMLTQLAKNIELQEEKNFRISVEELKQSLILQQYFIEIRIEVIQEFKKQIEKYRDTFPKQYNILRDFGEMEQQHPETEIQLFKSLELTFLPIKFVKHIYKRQNWIIVSQIFRMLTLETEFALNLAELYNNTLEDLCLMLNLSVHLHEQYRKKIIEELRDEINASKEYVQEMYKNMPSLIDQIKPMKDGRRIILSTKKLILQMQRDGEINQLVKQQFVSLMMLQEAKINNAGLGLEEIEIKEILHRNWIFECLSAEQMELALQGSKIAKLKQGKMFTINEIIVVLDGSLTKILNDEVSVWHIRGTIIGLSTIVPFFGHQRLPVKTDNECKLLFLQNSNMQTLIEKSKEFFRRICCFSLYPLIQINLDKAGDLGFYPERYILEMAKKSSLIECKASQVLTFEKGGYVLKGELISQENRTSYMKGTLRYNVHCYIPPSSGKVVCMRESLVLKFEILIPVKQFEIKSVVFGTGGDL